MSNLESKADKERVCPLLKVFQMLTFPTAMQNQASNYFVFIRSTSRHYFHCFIDALILVCVWFLHYLQQNLLNTCHYVEKMDIQLIGCM